MTSEELRRRAASETPALTAAEFLQTFCLPRSTGYKLLRDGKVPGGFKVGGCYRVWAPALLQLLDEQA
jgi:predicted DNA-binding transcriptional regulator AlpA